uniref:Uncharacterized protein n=1 Tax=Oryza glumipatula TaxID=40148 RepID=A0A0D9Y9V5_9ORYZ
MAASLRMQHHGRTLQGQRACVPWRHWPERTSRVKNRTKKRRNKIEKKKRKGHAGRTAEACDGDGGARRGRDCAVCTKTAAPAPPSPPTHGRASPAHDCTAPRLAIERRRAHHPRMAASCAKPAPCKRVARPPLPTGLRLAEPGRARTLDCAVPANSFTLSNSHRPPRVFLAREHVWPLTSPPSSRRKTGAHSLPLLCNRQEEGEEERKKKAREGERKRKEKGKALTGGPLHSV